MVANIFWCEPVINDLGLIKVHIIFILITQMLPLTSLSLVNREIKSLGIVGIRYQIFHNLVTCVLLLTFKISDFSSDFNSFFCPNNYYKGYF